MARLYWYFGLDQRRGQYIEARFGLQDLRGESDEEPGDDVSVVDDITD